MIAYQEQALRILERNNGADHVVTMRQRSAVGSALHASGRTAEALAQFRRALVTAERPLGPNDIDTGLYAHNAAVALTALDRAGEAVPLQRRALDIYTRALPRFAFARSGSLRRFR